MSAITACTLPFNLIPFLLLSPDTQKTLISHRNRKDIYRIFPQWKNNITIPYPRLPDGYGQTEIPQFLNTLIPQS
jgi:hypothetical protein